MAEPTPGAPGGGRSGPRSATAATFQVSDSSLKDLHTTWRRLIADVKEFNTELQNLSKGAKTVDQIAAKLGSLGIGGGGKGGAGTRLEGMAEPPTTPTAAVATGAPTAAPAATQTTATAATGGAPQLAGGSSPWGKVGTGAKWTGTAILGAAAGVSSFYNREAENISASNLFYNQQAQNTGMGYARDERDRMRATMFGRPGNDTAGLTGFQSMQDAMAGTQSVLGATGGRVGGRGWQQVQQAGQLAALTPDSGLAGSGAAVASLYDPETSARLMMTGAGPSVGPGGALQSPQTIYQNIIRTIYRGRKPSAEEIRQGMQPGAPLYLSLTRGMGLTPDAIQQFERYAIAQANLNGNVADTERAIGAASKWMTHGESSVSADEKKLIDRAGLTDSVRSAENRVGAEGTRRTAEAERQMEPGIVKGLEHLAASIDKMTALFQAANDKTGGATGYGLGYTGVMANPVNTALGALGGIGGAAMTWQTVQNWRDRRSARGAGGGVGGALGDAVEGVTGGGVQKVFVVNWPPGMLLGAPDAAGGKKSWLRRAGGAVAGAATWVGSKFKSAPKGGLPALGSRTGQIDPESGEWLEEGDAGYEEQKAPLQELYKWLGNKARDKFAGGGVIPGHHQRDDVPIYATPGEVVVPKPVVGRHGGARALMEKLGFRGTGGENGHYAGGGEVTGDTEGLNAEFLKRLRAFSAAVGQAFHVGSGHRSIEEQQVLYDRWMRRVPGQAPAAKPGKSNHNHGLAADGPRWGRFGPERFGLRYPMSYEPWHIEPVGAKQMKGGAAAAQPAIGTPEGPDGADVTGGVGTSSINMATAPGVLADEKSAMAAFLANANNPYGMGGTTKAGGIEAAPPKSSGTEGVDPEVAVPASHPNQNVTLGQSKAAARGWTGNEWEALYKLWQKESGWRTEAANPSSSARGIAQTMMSVHFGKGWKTDKAAKAFLGDPNKQIDWGLNYISQRYNSPGKAWAHSQKHNWYDVGAWETDDEYARLHRGEMVVPEGPAKKIRQMIRDRGQQVQQPTFGVIPQQAQRGTVSVNISMPVTLVGKATPQDARHLVSLMKNEMEQDETLAAMGSGG